MLGPFEEEEEGIGIARNVVEDHQAGHPRFSEGGQGEVVRRRFSIVGTYSLGSLVKKPRDRSLIPQYQFNKTKQHTPVASDVVKVKGEEGPLIQGMTLGP